MIEFGLGKNLACDSMVKVMVIARLEIMPFLDPSMSSFSSEFGVSDKFENFPLRAVRT